MYDEVLERERNAETIENAVRMTHRTKLDIHSELFRELRAELTKLRRAKEMRALLIEQMKERVRTMKLEIRDLESLRNSLRDLPPCKST